jgi:hypothetical protein
MSKEIIKKVGVGQTSVPSKLEHKQSQNIKK